MSQTKYKPILSVLAGEPQFVPPVWLMRQAGRYLPEYRKIRNRVQGFFDLCFNSKLAAEVTLQPVRRFGLDAAILFSDILVVPQAIGQQVRFIENEGPILDPVRNEDDLKKLSFNNFNKCLAPIYETVNIVKSELSREVTFIGFAGAPWTVATYMVEGGVSRTFSEIKRWSLNSPDTFESLIDLLVEATVLYLSEQVNHGVEVIQIFESHSGDLSEEAFQKWIIQPTKKLVNEFRRFNPGIPIIGFPRGAGLHYKNYVLETGIDAVGLDSSIPLAWAAAELQTHVPIQGNLEPQLLLVGGEPMERATRNILEHFKDGPFIFNLGHGIDKDTPPNHVENLVSKIRTIRSNI